MGFLNFDIISMTFFTYPTFWEHSGVTLDPFCEVTLDRNVLCWMAPTTNSFQLFVPFKLFCSSFTRPEHTRSCAQESPPKKVQIQIASRSQPGPGKGRLGEIWGGRVVYLGPVYAKKVFRTLISLRDSRRGDSRQNKSKNKSRTNFEFQSRVTPKWVQSDPKVLPTSSPKCPQSDP